jgi:DNA-binding transcriptional LysR family regulator
VALPDFAAAMVGGPDDGALRELVLSFFVEREVAPRFVVQAPSIEAIKRLVMAGLGVALLPELCIRDELQAGRLAPLSLARARPPARHLWTVQPEGRQPSSAARAFLSIVPAECLPRQPRARRPTTPAGQDRPAAPPPVRDTRGIPSTGRQPE